MTYSLIVPCSLRPWLSPPLALPVPREDGAARPIKHPVTEVLTLTLNVVKGKGKEQRVSDSGSPPFNLTAHPLLLFANFWSLFTVNPQPVPFAIPWCSFVPFVVKSLEPSIINPKCMVFSSNPPSSRLARLRPYSFLFVSRNERPAILLCQDKRYRSSFSHGTLFR